MDIRALKYEEVSNMKTAIENYTLSVEEEIKKLKDFEIGAAEGFYGAGQCNTVDGYIDETCVQINAIVRHFDQFKDALTAVGVAYSIKDANVNVGAVETAAPDQGDLINVTRME